MFVHCFAGKGAVLLSIYCCFYHYDYSYRHHYNYHNYYCYYYYHHYHIFFILQISLFNTDCFSSLVILGTYLPLNGLKNMCS